MLDQHRSKGAGTAGTDWVEEHRAAAIHSCRGAPRELEGHMWAAAAAGMAEDSAHHKEARHIQILKRVGKRAAPRVRAEAVEVDNGRDSGEAVCCAGRELTWSPDPDPDPDRKRPVVV